MKRIWFERGGALVLAIWLCYSWLAPSFPIDGESAEFATLSVTGGAAHPPGYPLYVLFLRTLAWLPGTTAAHTAALATTLLAVLGFVVLHAACRAWGARSVASTLTVAIVAAAPVVLRVQSEPEVFALNNLFAALILWLSAEQGPLRGGRRTIVLALVAGLGLSHHTTIVLLAPVGLLGAIRGVRESKRRVVTVMLAVAALAVGLTPYLSLLVAPETPMSWGRAETIDDLLAFFLRRDYGGPGSFAPYAGEVQTTENLVALAQTLLRSLLWLPLVAALAALAHRSVRGRAKLDWLALALSFAAAGPLLAAGFNVPPDGVGLLVCQRFHLLPLFVIAPAVAVGIDSVLRWLGRRIDMSRVDSPLLGSAVAILLFATLVTTSLDHHRAIASPAIEKSVAGTLRSLPQGAVVLTQTDDMHAGAIYVQTVLGVRPDVTVITTGMLNLPWYRARFDVDSAPLKVAEQVHAAGRPLFADLAQVSVLASYPTYPHGWLFRVLPRGAHVPPLSDIIEINRDITAHLDLAYPRPGPDDGYPSAIHKRYAQPWKIIGRALRDAGQLDAARDALELAHQLAPEVK